MFREVNKIYFEVLNYEKKYNSRSMGRDYMYDDIHDTLDMLLQNKYLAVVKELDEDLVVIEYNFNNDYIKTDATNPEWLTPEERTYVINHRKRKEEFLRKLP